MKTIVISLGGSVIVPESVDIGFLHEFKKTLEANYKKYKFVLVCGGGSIARKYISILEKEGMPRKELALAGIRATRMNAMTIMQMFGKEANQNLPVTMEDIKNSLKRNNVVICGALRYADNSTSDGTAAKIASFLKGSFVNLTNVKGLFTADPRKDKKARFIEKISWADFEKKALAIKHKPGQHFVLDQEAASLIKRKKITTYIIGKDNKNLSNLLKNKKFIGTTITE